MLITGSRADIGVHRLNVPLDFISPRAHDHVTSGGEVVRILGGLRSSSPVHPRVCCH
jgi:molybdenum cofactor biosynthesis enzyme MoaA